MVNQCLELESAIVLPHRLERNRKNGTLLQRKKGSVEVKHDVSNRGLVGESGWRWEVWQYETLKGL